MIIANALIAAKISIRAAVPPCLCRYITTSNSCFGKRNFRKFLLYGKRGSREFKKRQATNPDPDLPVYTRGCRRPGFPALNNKFIHINEMIPELVVPNLDNFKLKPYVSYRVPDVTQSEFTPKDLFDAVYSKKIVEDFRSAKLDSNGDPLEPSPEEKLTPEEAHINARKTGSDIFSMTKEDVPAPPLPPLPI